MSPLAHRLGPPVAAGIVIAFAFVALFTAALHAPKPHGLEVALVAPAGTEQALAPALDAAAPGGFELLPYATEGAARAALADQDVQGALVIAGAERRLLVAGAGGVATSEALQRALGMLAERQGAALAVEDVRPLPAHDARGLSPFFAIVGTTLGSLIFGVALFVLARTAPARARIATAGGFAVLLGLTVAMTTDWLTGSIAGSFWGVTGVIALLALAVGLTTTGLARLLGPAGAALAAALLVLLALPSTGGPVGHLFLPDFFGAISQLLPSGAALTALRSTVYFDGAGAGGALVVLALWIALGLAFELGAAGRERFRRPAPLPAAS